MNEIYTDLEDKKDMIQIDFTLARSFVPSKELAPYVLKLQYPTVRIWVRQKYFAEFDKFITSILDEKKETRL